MSKRTYRGTRSGIRRWVPEFGRSATHENVGSTRQAVAPRLSRRWSDRGLLVAALLVLVVSAFLVAGSAADAVPSIDKRLVKVSGVDDVWWVQSGWRYRVTEAVVLNEMQAAGIPGWHWDQLVSVSAADLSEYTLGPEFITSAGNQSEGLIIREQDTLPVHFLHESKRRHFDNPLAFNDYRFDNEIRPAGYDSADVIDVAAAALARAGSVGVPIYAAGQTNAGSDATEPAFRQGWDDLSAGNRSGLGFAKDLIRTDAYPSPDPLSGKSGSYQNFDHGGLELRQGDSAAFAVGGGIFQCWSGAECTMTPNPFSGSELG